MLTTKNQTVGAKQVLELAWPILVSMLSYTAMGILDTLLIAGLGTTALAAAGLGMTISFVLLSFGNGLLRGVKIVAAQRTGAGDHETAQRLAWQALWMSAFFGVPIALLAPFGPLVIEQLGASPAIASEAGTFLGLRLLGAPFLFAMTGLQAFAQGRGDTRSTLSATMVSNAVNIALDLVLLYGLGPVPAIGVQGAAIATVISWGVGFLWMLRAVRGTLATTAARLDRALLGAVWHLGFPMGLQFVLDVASFAFFATLLARVGEAHLAAHVIAIRIIGVSFMPGYAIGEAASVLVGQAVGARRLDQARAAWWESTRVAVAIMVGWALVFVSIPGLLVSVFRPEPEVTALVGKLLLIAAAFQVFDAVATVAYGALTGAGDTRFAMITNSGIAWGVKLPLAIWLAVGLELGAPGAWLGLAAEIAVIAAVSLWRIQSGRWLRLDEAPALTRAAVPA